MVTAALAKALVALCEAPMTGPSETLPALEQRLTERLLDFERLDVVEREAESAGSGLVG